MKNSSLSSSVGTPTRSINNNNHMARGGGHNKRIKPLSERLVRKRRSPLSSWTTWILLSALAICLFQTFTYQLPSHLSSTGEDHHHPANLMESSMADLKHAMIVSSLPASFGQERAKIENINRTSLKEVMKEAHVFLSLDSQERASLPALEASMKALYGPTNEDESNAGPVIYGMDTCEVYRQLVPDLRQRYVAPAGMFNTGTNNLAFSMQHNLERSSMVSAYYQVPWGKHRMEYQRLQHSAVGRSALLNQTNCLPIILIRDPYQWMQSMCKASYAAKWKRGPNRCPNLVVSERDKQKWKMWAFNETMLHNRHRNRSKDNSTNLGGGNSDAGTSNESSTNYQHLFGIPISIPGLTDNTQNSLEAEIDNEPPMTGSGGKNDDDVEGAARRRRLSTLATAKKPDIPLTNNNKNMDDDSAMADESTFQVQVTFDKQDIMYFDSLVDLWNDWYRPYWENKQKYPRLIIRFEDMLMHAPTIMEKMSECLGVPNKERFRYKTDSAKKHGSGTTFIKALVKTANETRREQGLTLKDKIYAAQHLDPELMHAFQYRVIEH